MAQDIYELITSDIISRIESTGRLPWQKPWHGANASVWPRNAATGRVYSGINVLILWSLGHDDMRYATFKQAQGAGGRVRKGSKGTRIVYWNMVERKDKDTGDIDIVPILRYYTVFNVADIDGATWKTEAATESPDHPDAVAASNAVSIAEGIYRGMPNRPQLIHSGGDRAYYTPSTDIVRLPRVDAFHTGEGYAETLFHELAHATGHETRLNRHTDEGCTGAMFGSYSYGREELVAEIGAAFIMATAGLDNDDTRTNNAAYVKSWTEAIKEDNRAIIYAAARAQKAADYITGTVESSAVPATEVAA